MLCCGPDKGFEARLGLGTSSCVVGGGLLSFSGAVFELICASEFSSLSLSASDSLILLVVAEGGLGASCVSSTSPSGRLCPFVAPAKRLWSRSLFLNIRSIYPLHKVCQRLMLTKTAGVSEGIISK